MVSVVLQKFILNDRHSRRRKTIDFSLVLMLIQANNIFLQGLTTGLVSIIFSLFDLARFLDVRIYFDETVSVEGGWAVRWNRFYLDFCVHYYLIAFIWKFSNLIQSRFRLILHACHILNELLVAYTSHIIFTLAERWLIFALIVHRDVRIYVLPIVIVDSVVLVCFWSTLHSSYENLFFYMSFSRLWASFTIFG